MMPDPPFVPAGVRPSPLCPGRRDVAAPASPEILLDEENVPQEPARDQDRRRSDQQPAVSLHRLLLPPVSAGSWRCLGADGPRRSAGQKPGERPASAARSVSDSPAQARAARAAVSTATRIDAVPELRMRVVLRSRDEERVDSARSEEVPAYTCAAERRTRNGEPAGQSFPDLPRVADVALSLPLSAVRFAGSA